MLAEIIVVEGKEDTVAVRRALMADTIETGGSAINEQVLRRIELAYERRGVIVFTDPDIPGEKIRKIITERVPGCKHAFLTKAEARGRDGIGVEHASPAAIRGALERVRSVDPGSGTVDGMSQPDPEITLSDLLDAGLLVHSAAASRRERMGELLGIGYANGKQFHKRCLMFRITREEFARAFAELEKEENRQ